MDRSKSILGNLFESILVQDDSQQQFPPLNNDFNPREQQLLSLAEQVGIDNFNKKQRNSLNRIFAKIEEKEEKVCRKLQNKYSKIEIKQIKILKQDDFLNQIKFKNDRISSVYRICESLSIIGTTEEKIIDEENCYYISQDLEKLKYYLFDNNKFKILRHIEKLNDMQILNIHYQGNFAIILSKSGINIDTIPVIQVFKLFPDSIKFKSSFSVGIYSQAFLEFHIHLDQIGLVNMQKECINVYSTFNSKFKLLKTYKIKGIFYQQTEAIKRLKQKYYYYLQTSQMHFIFKFKKSKNHIIIKMVRRIRLSQNLPFKLLQIGLEILQFHRENSQNDNNKKVRSLIQYVKRKNCLRINKYTMNDMSVGGYQILKNHSPKYLPVICYLSETLYILNTSNNELQQQTPLLQHRIYDISNSSIFIPRQIINIEDNHAKIKRIYIQRQKGLMTLMFGKMLEVIQKKLFFMKVPDHNDEDQLYDYEELIQNELVQIYDQITIQKKRDQQTFEYAYHLMSLRYKIYL